MALDLSTLELVPLSVIRCDSNGDEVEEGEKGYDDLEDPEPEFDFLCDVTRQIKLSGEVVGRIEAVIVKREEMEGEFHGLMDEPSQELCDFAVTLFDHNGRFRDEFIGPRGRKAGTGVFGRELSEGSFAYITEINITKRELRSQGVGKAALNLFKAFLLDAESGDRVWNQELNPVEFLLCWPVTLTSELERSDSPLQSFFSDPAPAPDPVREATRRRNLERVLSFFHDNGFRRVGTSEYFAFAVDPNHPSRRLAKDKDTIKLPPPMEPSSNPERDFPLHFKLANTSLSSDGSFDPALLLDIANSPLSVIRTADGQGFTPLHMAAAQRFLPAIQALVGRSRKELLATTLDGSKNLPLDLLKEERRSSEDFRRAMGMPGLQGEARKRDEACEAWLERETAVEMGGRKRKAEEEEEGRESGAAGGSKRRV